ncbi:MAG: CoA transferase subunit A [Bacillota bacterium]
MAGKIVTLAEAVSRIEDGCHVAMGGFAIARCPVAFAHELIRQGKKDLTLSQVIGGFEGELLVAAGAVRKIVYGGGSLDRFGPLVNINRAIVKGVVEAEEYSGLSMAFRFLAGSLGIPFIPIKSLLGSDLLERLGEDGRKGATVQACPFTGERLVLLKALSPDWSVVLAQRADSRGNTWLLGPTWDEELAKAAGRLIVITEQIVNDELARRNPQEVSIPGCLVDMVVEVPYGGHPTSAYRAYDYDAEHIREYVSEASAGSTDRYLDKYVRSTTDHWEYLEKCGGLERLASLRADPALGY